jgi:hypothetical protein
MGGAWAAVDSFSACDADTCASVYPVIGYGQDRMDEGTVGRCVVQSQRYAASSSYVLRPSSSMLIGE